jgi:hypothetical protein
LLKDRLLLLGQEKQEKTVPRAMGVASAPWSQDFRERELLRKETTRAGTTDDPLTPGFVHLLIDSPSTDPRPGED